jgi:hypothetical protein
VKEIELSRTSRLGIPLVGAIGVALLVVTPAQAGTCAASVTCPTTVTLTVTSPGGLTITVPDGPVSVGSGTPGNAVSGQLGGVTVSDQRAILAATWTASVTSTDLTTGGGTAAETILKSALSYWSGAATATTGTGTFTPGQANAGASQTLGVSRTAFAKTTGSGANTATWNPTLVVNIPSANVVGTYTGTVSHSVA